ncbi:MAG: YifB family Mg chelatase-like AAA ATPase [Elusimicrobiota bacterium]|nr:YifB family Mg chelatase-like AAA ATPase [Endomicrobiia bacterium]MDW8165521.1 YifB family Mg chelatase-like AAA ATPase [Elusimicrobiota bacterium]
MLSKVYSGTIYGIDGFIVEVEVDISSGLPSFNIVGLPDTAVKESKERVTSAIRNSGFDLPSKRITINLAPADLRKEGAGFDLPIALGILGAIGKVNCEELKNYYILGELALDGSVRPVKGVLPLAIEFSKSNNKKLIVPYFNIKETALTKIDAYPIRTLKEAVAFINKELEISPYKVDLDKLYEENFIYEVDFSEVKGQQYAKRAIEVAASGAHNIIMIGPPGAGKTMLASRIPTILPELSLEEAIETTRIYSVAGILDGKFISTRPFRAPHHTISDIALVGGGQIPKPGEISLAHNGVLFLDELPEFNRNVLEVLRQPLEKGYISVSRAAFKCDFPANIMLVAACNPCPCGYFGHPKKECKCSPYQIQRYLSKISGPLLDRIDIQIEVPPVEVDELTTFSEQESSVKIRERVKKARKIQYERYKNYRHKKIFTNSQLTSKLIKEFCPLTDEAKRIMKLGIEKMGFSARAYDRILKLARTIADMDNKEVIDSTHISEAIHYRVIDKFII